jgi:hypothetical protein
LAGHVEEWPWRPKVRHGFDMAGEKLNMPFGHGTLFARTLLHVNLQPAQTGNAEARRWHSVRQNL